MFVVYRERKATAHPSPGTARGLWLPRGLFCSCVCELNLLQWIYRTQRQQRPVNNNSVPRTVRASCEEQAQNSTEGENVLGLVIIFAKQNEGCRSILNIFRVVYLTRLTHKIADIKDLSTKSE